MCAATVEAVLSTIFFVLAVKGMFFDRSHEFTADPDDPEEPKFRPARMFLVYSYIISLVFSGYGAVSGLFHLRDTRTNIEQWAHRLAGAAFRSENLDVEGVDYFEYFDLMRYSLGTLSIQEVINLDFATYVDAGYGIRRKSTTTFRLCVLVVVSLAQYKLRQAIKLEGKSHAMPRGGHVRAFLLVSSMEYALVLHFSTVPFRFKWSLITVHSLRILRLLVSLCGQNEGAVDAASEFAGYHPE